MAIPDANARMAAHESGSTPPRCQAATPATPYSVTSGIRAATPRESTHQASWSTTQEVAVPAASTPAYSLAKVATVSPDASS